eukprot:SAG11_NODE_25144_length_363_cov_0.814394_1_plen_72_part_10
MNIGREHDVKLPGALHPRDGRYARTLGLGYPEFLLGHDGLQPPHRHDLPTGVHRISMRGCMHPYQRMHMPPM